MPSSLNWTDYYQPSADQDWSGRSETTLNRFYQVVQCLNLSDTDHWETLSRTPQQSVVLLGFASDIGVQRNQGRVGAKAGPSKLREKLGRLPHHFPSDNCTLIDAGTIVATDDLEASQAALGELIAKLKQHNVLPIVLGGGHETAWGHYLGMHHQGLDSLGIINFDAHLDMRPLLEAPQVGSSGTPFLQIAQRRSETKLPFNYTCIGLQKTANPPELLNQIAKWQVKTLFAEDCFDTPERIDELINRNIQDYKQIYVSVCLDVFASAYAPGVSAPSPHGCLPWQVLPALQRLAQSGKVVAIDIVELAPNLDENDKTAALGAALIAELIYHLKWD